MQGAAHGPQPRVKYTVMRARTADAKSERHASCGYGSRGVRKAKGTQHACAHRMQPKLVKNLLVIGASSWNQNGPLATSLALGILPLGLNALFEQMKVRTWPQPAGGFDVII